jgi:hypothetical protein
MNNDEFADLTIAEAREFLDFFVESGSQAIADLTPAAARDGIEFDYTLSSLPNALGWIAAKLQFHRIPIPAETPEWLKASIPPDIAEFDDPSKMLMAHASYYLGECFARLPGMHWTTGDPEYMEKHMPVVTGFSDGVNLPPLVVVKTLMSKVVGDGAPTTEFESVVAVWRRGCRE